MASGRGAHVGLAGGLSLARACYGGASHPVRGERARAEGGQSPGRHQLLKARTALADAAEAAALAARRAMSDRSGITCSQGSSGLLRSAVDMVAMVERSRSVPSVGDVVAALAGYAELPARRVRELLADDDLARLVGGLVADADTRARNEETVGLCVPRRVAADILGGVSRQAVAKRDDVELLAVRQPGRRWVWYPVFQFDGGRPLEGLADVLAVLAPHDPEGDGWAVAVWLRTPNRTVGGRTPEEALRTGEHAVVCSAAECQANAWGEDPS